MKLSEIKAKKPIFKVASPIDGSVIDDLVVSFKYYDASDYLKVGQALQSLNTGQDAEIEEYYNVIYQNLEGLIRGIEYESKELSFEDFKIDILENEDYFFVKKQILDFATELITSGFGDDKSRFFYPIKKTKK